MISWVARIVVALVVAILLYLLVIFVAGLLGMLNVPLAAYVGAFLHEFALVLAILAFLWALFRPPLTL
jgi:hypothetical protein